MTQIKAGCGRPAFNAPIKAMEARMSPFDMIFVAGVVAAFSVYGVVLFTAWLLVTALPAKAAKRTDAPPVKAERPGGYKLAA